MGNSTFTLQQIVDDASANAELAPALATGGYVDKIACSIATDVMQDMLMGGPNGEPFDQKWNRFIQNADGSSVAFLTNTWQQDYAVPSLVNLFYIESSECIDINSTQQPKFSPYMEVERELPIEWRQCSRPFKICWLPNDQLFYGVWGASSQANPRGLNNPGAGVVYTAQLTTGPAPQNPITQVYDSVTGTYWVLTTFGTCGNTVPTWTASPTYPTYANQTAVASTVADGSCVWTAINPKGQGFRLGAPAPTTDAIYRVQPIGQARSVVFTNLAQTLDPLPDDWVRYFKQGFFAECYRRNPDAKVRAKYQMEHALFLDALNRAVKAGAKEPDNYGFVAGDQIMDGGGYGIYPNAGYPYNGGWGY